MERQLENCPGANHLSRSNILDTLSVVGVIGGSVASLVSQQVAFAAIPLSFSVALNLANRRQLVNEMAQHQQSAIAQLSQQLGNHQTQINTLSEVTQQSVQSQKSIITMIVELTQQDKEHDQAIAQLTQQSQAHQTNIENLSEQIQHSIANLTQETQQLTNFTQNLDKQHKQLEEVVGEIRQVEDISQAISANPNSAQLQHERGLSHEHLGDKSKAIEDYTEAIRLDPNLVDAYYNRGVIRSEIGQRKEAVEDLRKAAMLYFEQRNIDSYEKARELIKNIHALNFPTNNGTNEKFEQLLVGNLFS